MPDTYTSQFSGEEIDAALRAAQIISGASTLAELRKKLEIRGDTIPVSAEDSTLISDAVKYRTNPNLLDNWYFANPVNQRGQVEYTAVGYTVDRWMIGAGSNGTLSLTESGLKLTRTDGVMYLAHRIPKTQISEGNTLTYSALTTLGLYSISFIVKNDTYHEQDVGGGISLGWNYTPAEIMELTLVNNTVNSDVTVLAAKLELGDTQTLAHKENGVWVLNEIPDFGEQLRRCQRYRWRFCPAEYVGSAIAFGISVNAARALIYLPEQMRTNPTLNFNKNTGLFLTGVDGDIFGMTLALVWTSPNSICVEFQKSGAFAPNSVYFVRGDASSAIDISADL